MFLGKYWCWSLQRLKGVIVGTFVFLPFHLVLVLERMIETGSLAKMSLLNMCGAQYVINLCCKQNCKLHENSNFHVLPIGWKWFFIICTRIKLVWTCTFIPLTLSSLITLVWTYTFSPLTLPSPFTLVWSTYTFIPLTLPSPITLGWTYKFIPFTLPFPPLKMKEK